jgi:DNA polymerase-3 subunit epsilon
MRYIVDGHAIMRKLIRDFELCPKLCYMQRDNEPCEGTREGYCRGTCEQKEPVAEYNKRVEKAIDSLKSQPSFAIIEKGLNGDDRSCVLVWEGRFYGMGYLPADVQLTDPEMLKEYVTRYKENSFIRNLVNGYAARFPSRVISLSREFQL